MRLTLQQILQLLFFYSEMDGHKKQEININGQIMQEMRTRYVKY